MSESDWRTRLQEAIKEDGRSWRRISAAAGNGPNYLQQVFSDNKDPGFSRIAAILDVLGTGAMLYVISGVRLGREEAELFKVLLNLPEGVRGEAVGLFRAIQSRGDTKEPPSSASG